jgi:DNA-binding MarR family transcriptional regulator
MSTTSPSKLTAHLSYWVRHVSSHATHGLGVRLAGDGVTVAEWTVLRELFGVEAVAPGRLADGLGITHGAISKLADRLIDKGLVAKREHHSDGRTHSLFLTSDGETLVPRLAAIADQHDADFFESFSDADRETMERLLRRLVERRALRPMPAPR